MLGNRMVRVGFSKEIVNGFEAKREARENDKL